MSGGLLITSMQSLLASTKADQFLSADECREISHLDANGSWSMVVDRLTHALARSTHARHTVALSKLMSTLIAGDFGDSENEEVSALAADSVRQAVIAAVHNEWRQLPIDVLRERAFVTADLLALARRAWQLSGAGGDIDDAYFAMLLTAAERLDAILTASCTSSEKHVNNVVRPLLLVLRGLQPRPSKTPFVSSETLLAILHSSTYTRDTRCNVALCLLLGKEWTTEQAFAHVDSGDAGDDAAFVLWALSTELPPDSPFIGRLFNTTTLQLHRQSYDSNIKLIGLKILVNLSAGGERSQLCVEQVRQLVVTVRRHWDDSVAYIQKLCHALVKNLAALPIFREKCLNELIQESLAVWNNPKIKYGMLTRLVTLVDVQQTFFTEHILRQSFSALHHSDYTHTTAGFLVEVLVKSYDDGETCPVKWMKQWLPLLLSEYERAGSHVRRPIGIYLLRELIRRLPNISAEILRQSHGTCMSLEVLRWVMAGGNVSTEDNDDAHLSVIRAHLDHVDEEVRVTALTLLCQVLQKRSDLLLMAEQFIDDNMHLADSACRMEFSCICTSLFRHVKNHFLADESSAFFTRIADRIYESLETGMPPAEQFTALNLLHSECKVFEFTGCEGWLSERLLHRVLGCVLSRYTFVRNEAVKLLIGSPAELMVSRVDREYWFEVAKRYSSSVRAHANDSGAALYDLLTKDDLSTAELLSKLLKRFDSPEDERNLAGILLSIKNLINRDEKPSAEVTRLACQSIRRGMSLANQALPILSVECPEGHVFEGESYHDDLLYSCAWRLIRENACLLETVMRRCFEGERVATWHQYALAVRHMLKTIRHNGAFMGLSTPYRNVCAVLMKHGEMAVVRQWLSEDLSFITQPSSISTTRRSAGLPICVRSVLMAVEDVMSKLGEGAEVFVQTMEPLFEMAVKDHHLQHHLENTVGPQVHAYNTLRELMSETVLARATTGWVDRAFILAIDGCANVRWPVRNAASLLLAALIQRTFSSGRSVPVKAFMDQHPQLWAYILRKAHQLQPTSYNLYMLLLVVERLSLSSDGGCVGQVGRELCDRMLVFAYQSPSWKVRTCAARIVSSLKEEFDVGAVLEFEGRSMNDVHGRLCLLTEAGSRALSTVIAKRNVLLKASQQQHRYPPTLRAMMVDLLISACEKCSDVREEVAELALSGGVSSEDAVRLLACTLSPASVHAINWHDFLAHRHSSLTPIFEKLAKLQVSPLPNALRDVVAASPGETANSLLHLTNATAASLLSRFHNIRSPVNKALLLKSLSVLLSPEFIESWLVIVDEWSHPAQAPSFRVAAIDAIAGMPRLLPLTESQQRRLYLDILYDRLLQDDDWRVRRRACECVAVVTEATAVRSSRASIKALLEWMRARHENLQPYWKQRAERLAHELSNEIGEMDVLFDHEPDNAYRSTLYNLRQARSVLNVVNGA